MDVRDLAPALLAAGQLVDAANSVLNDESVRVSVHVKATGVGSFEITLQVVQSLSDHLISLLTSPAPTAASTLATLIFGTPAATGLVWLIKKCKGKSPSKVDKVSDETVRIMVDGTTIEIPLRLLQLYQDVQVRVAAQRLVEAPLQKDGIDSFEVRENRVTVVRIEKAEGVFFAKPNVPDETLVDDVRRSAYSIISLAFKEDNKWRLHDGINVISASIADIEFLEKVDNNQIAFAKGDILVCEARVTQKQTEQGLRTEYTVEKVLEHRSAARQLPLPFNS